MKLSALLGRQLSPDLDQVARLHARERTELFSETATQKVTTPAVVEKEIWVTWVLNRLFQGR